MDKVKAVEEISKKHKVTLRQAAIQFAASHPAVVSIVLGAVNAGGSQGERPRRDGRDAGKPLVGPQSG